MYTYQDTLTELLILTISNRRASLTCYEHGKDFASMGQAIDHIRAKHASFIRRPGRLGETDTHGHYWYCFDCETALKDHRSFDSDEAMWRHLEHSHSYVMDQF